MVNKGCKSYKQQREDDILQNKGGKLQLKIYTDEKKKCFIQTPYTIFC